MRRIWYHVGCRKGGQPAMDPIGQSLDNERPDMTVSENMWSLVGLRHSCADGIRF